MNGQTAKKGDLALVVGLWRDIEDNGKIVEVTSDPQWVEGMTKEGWFAGYISWTAAGCCYSTNNLIPLPPDSESKRLFSDEPVEEGEKA